MSHLGWLHPTSESYCMLSGGLLYSGTSFQVLLLLSSLQTWGRGESRGQSPCWYQVTTLSLVVLLGKWGSEQRPEM